MNRAVAPSMSYDRPPGRRRLRLRVAGVILVGLAVGACSDDDGPSAASSTTTKPAEAKETTTSTTATTAPAADESQAVLAAYRGFWDAYIAATNPMNPEHPALAERAVGEEFDTVRKTIIARKSAGEVFQGTMELSPAVTSLSGDQATVRDCHDDNLVIVDVATGAVKEPDDPIRKLVTVTLRRDAAGAWKVAGIKLEAEGCTA